MDPHEKPTLLRLPTELLMAILLELNASDDHWNLAQVCLACGELRHIAQPILFSSFWIPQCEYSASGASGATHRLGAFTTAILSRPSLQTSVESIDTNVWDDYSENSLKVKEFSGWYRQTLLAAVEKVPFADKKRWYAGIENPRSGFLASLLVAITPGLLDLRVNMSEEDIRRMTGWMQIEGKAFEAPWVKPFTKLKKLDIGFTENAHMAYALPLLQLPTLREFTGSSCVGTYGVNGRRNVHEIRADSVYVETLNLGLARMDVEFLEALLGGCRNLLRLQYELMDMEFVSMLPEEDQSKQFSVSKLVSALSMHVPGIEELRLEFLLCEELEVREDEPLREIGTLEHLRKLSADLTTLKNLRIVPSHMEEIEIRRCHFDMFEQHGAVNLFMQLIEGKKNMTNNLKRVDVVVDYRYDLYGFFGLMKGVDAPELLLAAVYQQRERFKHAGLALGFIIQDVLGEEDPEFTELMGKDLDLVDMANCRSLLSRSGKDWNEWE